MSLGRDVWVIQEFEGGKASVALHDNEFAVFFNRSQDLCWKEAAIGNLLC